MESDLGSLFFTKFQSSITERKGFDLSSLCKVLNNLILQLNSSDSKDKNSLVDLLFLHDFLLSRDMFWGQFEGNISNYYAHDAE